jgi:hypothetical protein
MTMNHGDVTHLCSAQRPKISTDPKQFAFQLVYKEITSGKVGGGTLNRSHRSPAQLMAFPLNSLLKMQFFNILSQPAQLPSNQHK